MGVPAANTFTGGRMIYTEFEGELKDVLNQVIRYFQDYSPSGYGTKIERCHDNPDGTVWDEVSRNSSSD